MDVFKRQYAQGLEHFEGGRYAEAVQAFKEAYKARQLPRLLFNIGQTYLRMARAKEALSYFRAYKEAKANPEPEIQEELARSIAEAEALLKSAGRVSGALREKMVVVLEPQGEVRQREVLWPAVAQGLQAAELRPLSEAERDVVFDGEPALRGCQTGECLERIGGLAGAPLVMTQSWQCTLSGDRCAGWRFHVGLFDVAAGAMADSRSAACGGGEAEAAQALSALVQAAAQAAAARPRGRVEVKASPAADVVLDGRRVGSTPYARDAFAGKHDLTVVRAGYRSHHAPIVVVSGQTVALSVALRQGPNVLRVTRGPRPRWRIGVGAAAIGAGAVLVGFGASALSVNGQCIMEPVAPARVCDQIYRTTGVGAGLLVPGILLAAGGAVLIALPGEKRLVEASVEPLGGGAGLRLAGTF